MTRIYTHYTKELLEPIVASSVSYAECLRKLGLRDVGGNYKTLQKQIRLFKISTEHMLHQAANLNKEFVEFDNLTTPDSIKRRLLKELGYKCQKCELTTWLGHDIPLELEHVDGNSRNNARSNLTLLCCNCHAQTPTWRNRKREESYV